MRKTNHYKDIITRKSQFAKTLRARAGERALWFHELPRFYLVTIFAYYLQIINCFWLSCYYCLFDGILLFFVSYLLLVIMSLLLFDIMMLIFVLFVSYSLLVVYYIIWLYVSDHLHLIIPFWSSCYYFCSLSSYY